MVVLAAGCHEVGQREDGVNVSYFTTLVGKRGKEGGEKRREIEGKTVWRVYTSGQTGCPQLVRGREMKGGDSKSKRTCSRRVVRRCVGG